jgi:transposase-like protein
MTSPPSTALGRRSRRSPASSRRSPRKLTDVDVIDAAQRYLSGGTLAEIAQRLGVSPSTLSRDLRGAGVPIKPRGRPAPS